MNKVITNIEYYKIINLYTQYAIKTTNTNTNKMKKVKIINKPNKKMLVYLKRKNMLH